MQHIWRELGAFSFDRKKNIFFLWAKRPTWSLWAGWVEQKLKGSLNGASPRRVGALRWKFRRFLKASTSCRKTISSTNLRYKSTFVTFFARLIWASSEFFSFTMAKLNQSEVPNIPHDLHLFLLKTFTPPLPGSFLNSVVAFYLDLPRRMQLNVWNTTCFASFVSAEGHSKSRGY